MTLSKTKERKRVQGYIDLEHYRWIREKIREGEYSSESHAIRRAVALLVAYKDGSLLR